ncbi:hypothetical protein D3C87_1831340 [compost metagenome]
MTDFDLAELEAMRLGRAECEHGAEHGIGGDVPDEHECLRGGVPVGFCLPK